MGKNRPDRSFEERRLTHKGPVTKSAVPFHAEINESVSRLIEFDLPPKRVCKSNRCVAGQSEYRTSVKRDTLLPRLNYQNVSRLVESHAG